MTTAWLCRIDAWDGATPVSLRFASHDDDRLCHLDGATWWPAISKLPPLRYDFFDGAFAGAITEPESQMEVSLDAIPQAPGLTLHDCALRLWRGELGADFAAFVLVVEGRVKTQPEFANGRAAITFGVDGAWLDDPLLPAFAGTGGVEGGIDQKGTVKPLLLGAPRFVEGVLLDPVAQIYQLSGCGAINQVERAFDRLSRYGAPVGDATDYAVLDAMTLAPGTWAVCTAQGLVRLGAPPDGLLTFHARGDAVGGWHRSPGAIIGRIADIAGASAKVAAGTLAALDAARPWELSIAVTEQTTARDLIQRIAASVNAVATISWLGKLVLNSVGIGAPSLTLAADGSALPPVASVRQVAVSAPWWRLAAQAARTWRKHELSDIAFRQGNLKPAGQYDPARVYVAGEYVNLLDGSQWVFIGDTPTAGSTPADGNAHWERMSEALVPVDSAGNSLEALVNAVAGDTLTRSRWFFATSAPSAADSREGDFWVNAAEGNRTYRRVPGSGRLAIGGDAITLGGNHILLPWTVADDQRIGAAIANAATAQATADGKIESFEMYSSGDPVPVATDVGDILFRMYLNPVQVDQWNGSAWVSVATYGATAAQVAVIADIVSDAVLSTTEKTSLVPAYASLNERFGKQNAKGATISVALTERAAAVAAMSALNSYLGGLSPAWYDTSQNTPIVQATFQSIWNAAYSAVATLEAAVLGAPIGTPVGTITAADVSNTIKNGGGVGAGQVDTDALTLGAASGGIRGRATGIATMSTTAYANGPSVTVTPDSVDSLFLILAEVVGYSRGTSGGVTVPLPFQVNVPSTGLTNIMANSDASNSASAATMLMDMVTGLTAPTTFTLQWRAVGTSATGAQLDLAEIVVIELKRAA